MSKVSNFKSWRVNEVRRARKCTIEDFTPLRESTLYKDLIALGWEEVNAQGYKRIDPALELGKTELTFQVQYQGEKQGNLRFKHEKFPGKIIRTNLNGAIWEDPIPPATTKPVRISLEWDSDPKWERKCLTLDDYKDRLEYLIKKLLFAEGFISRTELGNKEGGVEIIQRKLAEDASSVRDLRVVPPSLQKDAGYIKKASDYGLF
jgi:hypothetical protein